jgi:hypothetical protein
VPSCTNAEPGPSRMPGSVLPDAATTNDYDRERAFSNARAANCYSIPP